MKSNNKLIHVAVLILCTLYLGIFFLGKEEIEAEGKDTISYGDNENASIVSQANLEERYDFILRGDSLLNGANGSLISSLRYDSLSQKYTPLDTVLWQKQKVSIFSAFLIGHLDSLDLIKSANAPLEAFIVKNGLSLKDDPLMLDGLIKAIETAKRRKKSVVVFDGQFYMLPETYMTKSLAAESPLAGIPIKEVLLTLIGLLSLIGLLKKNKIEPKEIVRETKEEISEVAMTDKTTKDLSTRNVEKEIELIDLKSKMEQLELYSTYFFKKYGDIYDRIENLPYDFGEKEKGEIQAALFEMAIHAHTYHRLVKMKDWVRFEKSPNVQLLMGKERDVLTKSLPLRDFVDDPQKMDKKFRYLMNIMKGMHISELDVFLRDEVNVSSKDL